MNFRSLCSLTLLATLMVGTGCKATVPASQNLNQQMPDVQSHSDAQRSVAAHVGGAPIYNDELDHAAEEELHQLDEEIYAIKRNRLQQMVEDRLWSLEAKEKGVSPEALKKQTAGETDVSSPSKASELKRSFLAFLSKKYEVRIDLTTPRKKVSIGEAPVLGKAEAPITLVEFSDFQCPFCSRVQPAIEKIRKTYGDQIRFVFKHYPLPFHKDARPAHLAALCAEEQGKFWEYRSELFRNQKDLSRPMLFAHAKRLGFNMEQFETCLTKEKYAEKIDDDLKEAAKLGVSGTPAFFINGIKISGAQPFESFQKVIDEELTRSS